MSNMRIAIFSDNFYPELSGISDSIIIAAKELVKRGHDIDFYVPKYSKKNYASLKLPHEEIDLGKKIRIFRYSSFPFKTGTGQGRVVIPFGRAFFKFFKDKPDIIHAHLPFGMGLEVLIASKLLKIPLVGTNHTPITEFIRYSPFKSKSFEKKMLRYNTWFYNKCNFVSSPSNAILEDAKQIGFSAENKVIPNPIDIKQFKELKNKDQLKKKLGLSGFNVIYSGRIAPEKNIDVIIRAVAKISTQIPDLKLILTGKGSAENQLKKLARSLNIDNKVLFYGFVNEPDLIELYNASDVFVIMSTAEVQCIAAMKAMACGIPVIGVRSWGLKEYISHNKTGLLTEIGDYNALADQLIFLWKNPQLRKQLGLNGKKDVKKFDPDNISKIWENIYAITRSNY